MQKLFLYTQAIVVLGACCTKQTQNDKAAEPYFYENSVAGVTILDWASATSFIEKHGPGYEFDDGYIHRQYLNSSGTQILDLILHPGSTINTYSQIKVSTNNKQLDNIPKLELKEFSTEKGIKLGMSKKYILIKLGEQHSIERSDGSEIYRYECTDDNKCKFLHRFNLPKYEATYLLNQNKLEEFIIGFPYP